MQPVKQNFCRSVISTFCNRIDNESLSVNTDETAIYPISRLNLLTIDMVSAPSQFALAVIQEWIFTCFKCSNASSRTAFIFSFLGQCRWQYWKIFIRVQPNHVYKCVRKRWIQNRTVKVRYNKIYEPYCKAHHGKPALWLDDFVFHKDRNTHEKMQGHDVLGIKIQPHYT